MSESELSVEHFRHILTNESQNLTQLCDQWSNKLAKFELDTLDEDKMKEQEEYLGAIRTTIGQAKLLMSQRFKQFSGLIDNCESNTGEKATRLDDLLGFWEMISYQVRDVYQKFKSLEG